MIECDFSLLSYFLDMIPSTRLELINVVVKILILVGKPFILCSIFISFFAEIMFVVWLKLSNI